MRPGHPEPSLSRRRALAALALGIAAPGAIAACSARSAPGAQPTEDAPPTPQVTYDPKASATDVAPTSTVVAKVQDGNGVFSVLKRSEWL